MKLLYRLALLLLRYSGLLSPYFFTQSTTNFAFPSFKYLFVLNIFYPKNGLVLKMPAQELAAILSSKPRSHFRFWFSRTRVQEYQKDSFVDMYKPIALMLHVYKTPESSSNIFLLVHRIQNDRFSITLCCVT